jgi:penicillin-binding protein 1B
VAVRIQVPKKAALVRFVLNPWGRAFLIAFILVNTIGLLTFTYYYVKYAKMIEEKLAAGPFANTSLLFAAPQVVMVGDQMAPNDVVAELRRSNYSDVRNTSRMGWYNVRSDAIEIYPGPDSFFLQEEAVIKFAGPKVKQIISLTDNSERTQYLLEPELITNLFDRNREKRRIVRFQEIPKTLVNAVISAEDKRFFQHSGFDPIRIIKSAFVDVKEGRNAQGASTLTMQLARQFWLSPERTWKRKFPEMMITLHLEQKLSKEQIFEYYANQIDLGRRGSFAIRGFGEAAQAYFGKDIRQLSLAECATLAGLIQSPSARNPVRWPERAKVRRNIVLRMMRDNGYISDPEYALASSEPMVTARAGSESTDAPYFVDLVNESLQDDFQEHDFQTNSYRVYTSLDMNLQHDAAEAVRVGMQEVDAQIKKKTKKGQIPPEAQCAMVVLDAQTGEVKALIGGRDYGISQLNRALAKRQPGSVFKPFVYAAALNTAINGGAVVLTPASTVLDEPTTFYFDNIEYRPGNFEHTFHGTVTLRQALAKSLNVPTVKVAEEVGYKNVVDLARRAGLNMNIRPTPAVALGAYEVTPLEIAGAYTMYANKGVVVKPNWIQVIRSSRGAQIYENQVERKPVLDPRVDFMMVDMMQEVLRSGTGAGVRSRGFTLPAAGKTGTSHDGWFAGFTSKLLCVVWVGFDDNKELNLEGAKSALPIWVEFMKRAHQHREYRNVHGWEAPDGVVNVDIDPASGQLATASCPSVRGEYFISGTQPVELCRLHSNGGTQVAGWETVPPKETPASVMTDGGSAGRYPHPTSIPVAPRIDQPSAQAQAQQPQPAERPREKKGFFGRIKDIFK